MKRSKVTDYAALRDIDLVTANDKGSDQTAWMRRLVCAFVRNQEK